MPDQTQNGGTVFLTDGSTFLGPYAVGDFALVRGRRHLVEVCGAAEVYAVKAPTLEQAKSTFARRER